MGHFQGLSPHLGALSGANTCCFYLCSISAISSGSSEETFLLIGNHGVWIELASRLPQIPSGRDHLRPAWPVSEGSFPPT